MTKQYMYCINMLHVIHLICYKTVDVLYQYVACNTSDMWQNSRCIVSICDKTVDVLYQYVTCNTSNMWQNSRCIISICYM